MGLFYAKNGAEFIKELNAAVANMKREADEVFRGFATATFHRAAMETPQWSGNAAYNWNVSKNQEDGTVRYEFKEAPTPKDSALSKGNPFAVSLAVRRATSTLLTVSINDKVFVCNSAESLDNESYIAYLEENPNNFLRAVNSPGHMIERTANKAASLGRLTPLQELALRALRPGQLNNGAVGI